MGFMKPKVSAPAPTVAPEVTPVPPPPQLSSSIQAQTGQQWQSRAAAGMGFGDTLLTGSQGASLQDKALGAPPGKKLTGA